MTDALDVARRFYAALHDTDVDAILATVADDFVGWVTEGLPGIGGEHRGPKAMLEAAWIPAYRDYGVLPRPDELLAVDAETVVVVGEYEGRPPGTGVVFSAAFAHVIRVRGGQMTELRQITDSACWIEAARGGEEAVAVVRQVFDAVRRRDLDMLLDAYADDVVVMDDPALPYGGTFRGHRGAVDHAAGYVETWDPYQDEEARDPREEIVPAPSGPKAHWTLEAERDGHRVAQAAASLFEIRDGKVARLEMLHADTAALLAFLGQPGGAPRSSSQS